MTPSREGQLVKPLRVAKQDRFFVVSGELGVFTQLFQLMFAGFRINFVRIIGGENKRLVAGDAYRLGDGQFFSFAADEDAAFIDVAAEYNR